MNIRLFSGFALRVFVLVDVVCLRKLHGSRIPVICLCFREPKQMFNEVKQKLLEKLKLKTRRI